MNVVLVHGIFDSGAIMSGLAQHLGAMGHTCFVPSLTPNDARHGLPALAAQLAEFVSASISESSRFAIVGFSMGAIISRYYLQELGGHHRAEAFFSICGPHAGTLTAYLHPGDGARQMRPNSSLLAQLDASCERMANIPTICYWTPFDLMIRPVKSARWPRGVAVRIPALIHPWILKDLRLHRDIASHLSRI